MGRYRSGQTGETVNLLAYAFSGSNPLLPNLLGSTMVVHSAVNRRVAGSSPARAEICRDSSVVEQRFCKPSVVGSNPTLGSWEVRLGV